MVPETHVLEGVRAAAIGVFEALFKVGLSEELGLESIQVAAAAQEIPAVSSDPRMDLLRVWQDTEAAFRTALRQRGEAVDGHPSLPWLLRAYSRTYWSQLSAAPELTAIETNLRQVVETRNKVAHGAEVDVEEAAKAIDSLRHLSELLGRDDAE